MAATMPRALSAVLADNAMDESAMPRGLLAGTIQQVVRVDASRRVRHMIVTFSRGPGRLDVGRFLSATPGVRYRHGRELLMRYTIDDHHVAFAFDDDVERRVICAGARSLIEAQACWQWFFTRVLRPYLLEQ